jgi:hypothetical protein
VCWLPAGRYSDADDGPDVGGPVDAAEMARQVALVAQQGGGLDRALEQVKGQQGGQQGASALPGIDSMDGVNATVEAELWQLWQEPAWHCSWVLLLAGTLRAGAL